MKLRKTVTENNVIHVNPSSKSVIRRYHDR